MTTRPPSDEPVRATAIRAMRVIVISDTPVPPPLVEVSEGESGSGEPVPYIAPPSAMEPEPEPTPADAGRAPEGEPEPEPAAHVEVDLDIAFVESEPSSPTALLAPLDAAEPDADDSADLDISVVESELSSPYGSVAPFELSASVEPPQVVDVGVLAEQRESLDRVEVAAPPERDEPDERASAEREPEAADESPSLDVPVVESELSSPYGAVAPFEPAASLEPPPVAVTLESPVAVDVTASDASDAFEETHESAELDISVVESELSSPYGAVAPFEPAESLEPPPVAPRVSDTDTLESPVAVLDAGVGAEPAASLDLDADACEAFGAPAPEAEEAWTPEAADVAPGTDEDVAVELLGEDDFSAELDDDVILAVSPLTVVSRPPGPPPPRKRRAGIVTTRELPLPTNLAAEPVTPDAGETERPQLWWETLFSSEFSGAVRPLSDAHVRQDVNFIDESFEFAAGADLLDLACGCGQHAVGLAARGYAVTGLDYSPDQLVSAKALALRCRSEAEFCRGDMRELDYDAAFDGVMCWNSSFGYFEEDKNMDILRRVHRALRPGGAFLIDVANRDYAMNEAPSSEWFEGHECVCMDEMEMDSITSRLRVRRTLMPDAGGMLNCYYTIRLYSLHELGRLLRAAGFRVTQASGHIATRGAFFGPTSPRIIIRAQKPA